MPTGVYDRTKSRTNLGEFGKRPPWNKGITGQYSKEYREKISNGAMGNRSAWKGGRRISWNGYVQVYNPTHPCCDNRGYIREHRVVVEAQIGRYLLPTEQVHHRGTKDDNRPCMLMGFTTRAAHNRFEKGCVIKLEEIIFDGRKLI